MGTPTVMVFTILGGLGGTRIFETHLRTLGGCYLPGIQSSYSTAKTGWSEVGG
jgi:hypothetical protein